MLVSAFVCTPPSLFVCSAPFSHAIEGGHVWQPARLDHVWIETEVLTIGAILEESQDPFLHFHLLSREPCVTPVLQAG